MSSEVTGKSLTYVEVDLDVYRATIFENAPVAAGAPLNWSGGLLNQTQTLSVIADVAMPSGKALRMQKTAGNRSVAQWNALPSIRDVSVVVLLRWNKVGPTNMGVGVRISGGDGAESGYFCHLLNDATVNVSKIVGGVFTSLANPAFVHTETEALWMRFDALNVTGGVLLRAKVWRGAVEDEPDTFVASFTEVTSIFAAGVCGLFSSTTNAPDFACGMFRARSVFSQTTETLRFARSTTYLPTSIDAIPSLLEVQVSPGAVSLGENLGERASITAAFKDHKHADLGEMFDRGTFWGKFRGRQLFRRGEPIRVVRGLLGQALVDMESRHFVLDSFSGPSFSGAFQMVGKDPLKLADDDRALAPRPSSGFLIANILAADATMTLSPGGIGAAEYPATGYAAIGGKEVVAFSRGGNDAFTKVLLHCDGVDASTTFTDSNAGGGAHTWTASGNAQIDTADSKFGGASGLFDGTGDFVSTPDSADFTLGSSDFTIDFWFKCVATTGSNQGIGGQNDVAGLGANTAWRMFRNTSNQVLFQTASGGTYSTTLISTSQFTNIVNPGWHHCAVTRSGSTFSLFIDGLLEATAASAEVIDNSTLNLVVGRLGNQTIDWTGWIDEFRLSVGAARWTGNFVPPVGAYVSSGDAMAIARAQFGTTAVDHQSEDRVQLCLNYVAQSPAVIVSDLLINYAGVPPAYVSVTDWQLECDSFLQRLYTKLIADPAGVQQLVSKMIQQAGLAMWWDSVSQKIKLQVLRGVPTNSFLYNQSNVLTGSISVQEQPDKRITQVWTYYGVRNPLSPLDRLDNYRSGLVTVDLETENLNGGAVIKTIFADWIPTFGRQTAQRVNDLQIGRFKNPPRQVAFDVMRYSGVTDPQLGGGYLFNYWGAQDEVGSSANIPIQVTRLNPMADRFRVEAEEMLFTQQAAADLTNRVILFDSNVNSVNLRSVHDSIYPVPTDADVIAGVNLTVTVAGGVIVGSNSPTTPALDVGSWPTGFVINVVVVAGGRVQGAGGFGADGGSAFGGGPGQQGGTALFTRKAIALNLSAGGKIYGGGGGGGGGAGGFVQGGAGGGGAGRIVGPAGLSSNGVAAPGTLDAGGVGGLGGSSAGNGGSGGTPGAAGAPGTVGSGGVSEPPGAAGNGIDGVSFVTTTLGSGSILGPQIN